MILAGDVGGTKTILALFEHTRGDLRQVRSAIFPSRAHNSLEEILAEFRTEGSGSEIETACFGVAGAVIDGECRTTNLPWQLSEAALRSAAGTPRVTLLNDLQAAAYGMLHLPPQEVCVLQGALHPGRQGNIAVIAAGTGLGEGILYWDGSRYQPLASEGGHSDFAPRTDIEMALLLHLRARFGGHVSSERVLSGPGLHATYAFLRSRDSEPEPTWLAEQIRSEDASAAIASAALARSDRVSVAALELFVSVYGAEAGNLALACFATGGVMVGGGIAPKILPMMKNGLFLDAFTDKGRFAEFMKSIEVRVALNPQTALLGAAYFAAEH